jgi:hypothetical protein
MIALPEDMVLVIKSRIQKGSTAAFINQRRYSPPPNKVKWSKWPNTDVESEPKPKKSCICVRIFGVVMRKVTG